LCQFLLVRLLRNPGFRGGYLQVRVLDPHGR
jgi:hypothetical protein